MMFNIKIGSVESPICRGSTKPRNKAKSNQKLIEVLPLHIQNRWFGKLNNELYELKIPDDFCPEYLFSSSINDKYTEDYIINTTKNKNYKLVSKWWKVLSETIIIKGIFKNETIHIDIDILNNIYSKHFKKQNNEYYRQSKR